MLFDEYLLFEFHVSKAGSRTRVLSMCFLTLKKTEKHLVFIYMPEISVDYEGDANDVYEDDDDKDNENSREHDSSD